MVTSNFELTMCFTAVMFNVVLYIVLNISFMFFIKIIDYDFWAILLKLFSSVKRVTVPSFILLSSRSGFHLIWAIIRSTSKGKIWKTALKCPIAVWVRDVAIPRYFYFRYRGIGSWLRWAKKKKNETWQPVVSGYRGTLDEFCVCWR